MPTKKAPMRQKIQVTKRALVQRVNRKLAEQNARLWTARSERDRMEFGDFALLDLERNFIQEKNLDLEEVARKLGVLAAFEELRKGE